MGACPVVFQGAGYVLGSKLDEDAVDRVQVVTLKLAAQFSE